MTGARRVWAAASYLAVWPGLYVAASVLYVQHVVGWATEGIVWRLLAFALAAAMGVYLLDRVKFRGAWLDPADEAAHPGRYIFIARHAGAVRAFALLLFVVAGVLGWGLSPWLAGMLPAAALGVFAYAGRPRRHRARIKDVLLLKNLFVGAAITGFGVMLSLMPAAGGSVERLIELARDHAAGLVAAAATLLLRVFADAALCDLDDEASDREHGTVTLPTVMGRRPAWLTAMTLRLIAAAALWLTAGGQAAPRAWAVVTVASTVGLWLYQPARLRDLVDGRFALEAGAVLVVLAV